MADNRTAFPARYSWQILPGLPGQGYVYQFHRKGRRTHSQGLVVEVNPEGGDSWIGNFQLGLGSLTHVYTHPDENSASVVSAGDGYLVRVRNPNSFEIVGATPIIDVRLLIEKKLVLFASFNSLAAYNSTGLAWKSERIGIDELKVLSISPDKIVGSVWDPSKGGNVEFQVDLATGKHEVQRV